MFSSWIDLQLVCSEKDDYTLYLIKCEEPALDSNSAADDDLDRGAVMAFFRWFRVANNWVCC